MNDPNPYQPPRIDDPDGAVSKLSPDQPSLGGAWFAAGAVTFLTGLFLADWFPDGTGKVIRSSALFAAVICMAIAIYRSRPDDRPDRDVARGNFDR
ncbi:hypothetical protein FYK55_23680 [Roseiconus nitratireducens]|uniref:Uncharacterized protein n=1 Tax=Roseiconus nitratireducens TaxID=2605748 RepID=A0A5M6CWH9_9BACT|nr:hypothetical protein [Roseiconus nitratireducens]KAA5539578.1 hypothetical protein FYK55_23680 [Roseiconus nitratireducens]